MSAAFILKKGLVFMVGVIITGHNLFSSGLRSSLEMVGGKQDNLINVDFPDGQGETEIMENLQKAVADLDSCDYIVICCDLMGGTPFKMSATLAVSNPKVKVLFGVNLGMMLEFVLQRDFIDEDMDTYLNGLVERGKSAVGKFEYVEYEEEDDDDFSDGL